MQPQIFKNENLYNDIYEKVSKELNLPIYLLKSFSAIESGFNPYAYRYEPHRKDASYGINQILTSTARTMGFKGKPDDLYDVYTNLYWSGKYIKGLLEYYKDLDKVFASYNMGFPRPASKTTEIIKKIYGEPKPDWKYANQPYVDRGLAYYCYFYYLHKGDVNTAWKIYKLIMNKKHKEVWKKYNPNALKSIIIPLLIAIPVIPLLSYLWKKT